MSAIRIGTRGSRLALAQARQVLAALRRCHPRERFRLIIIRTSGDEFQGVELFKKKGIGVFTKEIERALLLRRIDMAVHSLKDLPTEPARGLVVAAVPKRASAADALLSRKRHSLQSLPAGAKVGTGSPRRKRQLQRLRPDLRVVDLRGNLDTRVSRVLREKKLDAIVVARAGLERLKKFSAHWRALDTEKFLPAVGQGALAIQTRLDDKKSRGLAASLNHTETARLVAAEREFLNRLGGGCRVPVGLLSDIKDGRVRLKAAVFSTRSRSAVEGSIESGWGGAEKAARHLADRLLRQGAKKFLSEARA